MKAIILIILPLCFCDKLLITGAPKYAAMIRPSYYNITRLSVKEEETLKSFIDFKNRIPRFTMYLEWLEYNTFRPQYSKYREGIGMIGIYYLIFFDFCILLSSLLLFFRIYLRRANYAYRRPKKSVSPSTDSTIINLMFLGISALVFYVGLVISSYGNISIFVSVRQGYDLIKSEASTLSDNVETIRSNLLYVKEQWADAMTDYVDSDIDETLLSLFYTELKEYSNDVTKRVNRFATPAISFEIGRFAWVWIQIAISMVIIGFALAGYMPCKCLGIVTVASVIVFTLFAEISALLAYSSSEILVIADICEQLHKISRQGLVPHGTTGIGYYLVPVSADNTGLILKYLLKSGQLYDTVILQLNEDLGYEDNVIDTIDEVRAIIETDTYSYNVNIKNKAEIILKLYDAIKAMHDIKNNRHIREFSNKGQDRLCLNSLTKCAYAYIGIGLFVIANIFIVIISIQIVKARAIIKFKAAVKFIGTYRKIQKAKKQ